MKKKQLEKLKKDPNLELCFSDQNKKNLDTLYAIRLRIETKEKTTEKEKEIYGVEFKKGDKLTYTIHIATNDKKELIYVIGNRPEYINLIFSYGRKDIFFNDFESARKFLELNIQQQIINEK